MTKQVGTTCAHATPPAWTRVSMPCWPLLARDLEGHTEYLQKVRYRLVPHAWQAPRQRFPLSIRQVLAVSDSPGQQSANQKLTKQCLVWA